MYNPLPRRFTGVRQVIDKLFINKVTKTDKSWNQRHSSDSLEDTEELASSKRVDDELKYKSYKIACTETTPYH